MTDTIDRDAELRLYFILRRDHPLTPGSLVKLAARGTHLVLKAAREKAIDRFEGYDAALQPKIALRAKDAHQIRRAVNETGHLPQAVISDDKGTPILMALGPVAKRELPKFVQGLQMVSSEVPFDAKSTAEPLLPSSDTPLLTIVVRDDAEIPYGKLLAQAGHGAWGALRQGILGNQPSDAVLQWEASGMPVSVKRSPNLENLTSIAAEGDARGIPSAFIVDAGRTVFSEPTPTVVGFGPVSVSAAGFVAALDDLD
jgi:peptidyl-tRNA hydrolase